ncbi:unnamed protein product [Cyclocybe aegerita]|uniref:Reverse transcriptase RNase H-like domain-containing protein n=1 Tax=Cyclocybe aegerita TaxID=1973307 RepID=A0A8S0VT75_CYCAE|nr:unnamed protein product [Cyclocybe aegerita]
MFIPKPAQEGEPTRLRTVIDLRARNANTKKMASPLPDIDGIMCRVASKKYRSVLDLKDAYEQVRVEPQDVWKMAFATPNGNMRAFDEVKALATQCKDHHRRPLNRSPGAPPINLVTDGCATGIAGVISQGEDWKTAIVSAFYSAKLSPTQQNYATHEIEMLAGLETMMHYCDLLLGTHFWWFTDHKGLVTVLNHQEVSGRRARWLEKLRMFDFEVTYVPGTENILSNALSRIYSNNSAGTVHAPGEYTEYDDTGFSMKVALSVVSAPVLVGPEAESSVVNYVGRRSKRLEGASAGGKEKGKTRAVATTPSTEKLTIRLPVLSKLTSASGNEASKDSSPENNMATHTELAEPISDDSVGANSGALDEIPPLDLTKDISGIDILKEIRNNYSSDTVFKPVVEKPSEYKNFDVKDGFVYLKQGDRKLLGIPSIKVNNRSAQEIIITEGHSVLAHLGFKKTYDYLRESVWWKTMSQDIQKYCDSCMTCKRSKDGNQKPYGLLNPLDVPGQPWDAIGIDFIGPLPDSRDRDAAYDEITVIIDLFTGMQSKSIAFYLFLHGKDQTRQPCRFHHCRHHHSSSDTAPSLPTTNTDVDNAPTSPLTPIDHTTPNADPTFDPTTDIASTAPVDAMAAVSINDDIDAPQDTNTADTMDFDTSTTAFTIPIETAASVFVTTTPALTTATLQSTPGSPHTTAMSIDDDVASLFADFAPTPPSAPHLPRGFNNQPVTNLSYPVTGFSRIFKIGFGDFRVADNSHVIHSISAPQLKQCLIFHQIVSKAYARGYAHQVENLVEPIGYRELVAYLNNDHAQSRKLAVITQNDAVAHFAPNFGPDSRFPLDVDFPDGETVKDLLETVRSAGGSSNIEAMRDVTVTAAREHLERRRGPAFVRGSSAPVSGYGHGGRNPSYGPVRTPCGGTRRFY